MQIPFILRPLVRYDELNLEEDIYGLDAIRNDLCESVKLMNDYKFTKFCSQILSLQHFRYKLNNSVACESPEDIPPGQEIYFDQEIFEPEYMPSPLFLPETKKTRNDPGVIIQQCLRYDKPKYRLVEKLRLMSEKELILFINKMESIEYFSAVQSGCFFSKHPELIQDKEHFWYIDDKFFEEDLEDKPD